MFTIAPPPPDTISSAGIAVLAVAVATAWAWTWAHGRGGLRIALLAGAAIVMAGSALAAVSGVLQRFDAVPPPMAVMIAGVFGLAFAVGLSPFGRTVAMEVPFTTLIGLQAFRLPLELVMHRAARLGIMPPELSYSGYNFDIVTGAGALVLWALLRSGARVPTWVAWGWNLYGIWSLGAIAFVAVATSPMVRLFGDAPRHVNTWVLYLPYVWLPAILVTIAVAGHVVITRKLVPATSDRLSRA